ncbi:MAG: HEPN domain-containing protein [Candidatus Aenigmarchaeota archaeon]|nr:HEPN domain-containing protein [Candidatus Aenigmarchaeota archaeon]
MINSFERYLKMGKAKRKTPDPEESRSLLQKAEKRLQYVTTRAATTETAAFVLEDAYETAREAAQSLMSLAGFKPYSHEATLSFLREYYGPQFPETVIAQFDRFRQLRHDSIYKAVDIVPEDARACLSFARDFLGRVKPLVDASPRR